MHDLKSDTAGTLDQTCWLTIAYNLPLLCQAALVRKDEEMEVELSSLRQQHERLKLQFQACNPLQ